MKRFSSVWRIAIRLPMVMVSMMTTHSSGCHQATIDPNTFTRMMASVSVAAPLETTLR